MIFIRHILAQLIIDFDSLDYTTHHTRILCQLCGVYSHSVLYTVRWVGPVISISHVDFIPVGIATDRVVSHLL